MPHPLSDRLKKVKKHLAKWAKRQGVSCYRIYQKDLNDYPLIVDWYDGASVAWLYERKKDETDEAKIAFIEDVKQAICEGLEIRNEELFLKHRYKLKGLNTQYEKISDLRVIKTVEENGLLFEVNLTDYLDTGLFLDHRLTRQRIREMSSGKRVLNLFSYTGSFTCYAISGGAIATKTVDLNPNYCAWAIRNMQLNGFSMSDSHDVICTDCRTYLKECTDVFDIIICDPPTFSNSKRTDEGVWSVNEDYSDMIQMCLKHLSPGGSLVFSTNSKRFQLDTSAFSYKVNLTEITSKLISEDFKQKEPFRCWEVTVS